MRLAAVLRRLAQAALVIVGAIVLSLALPVDVWRTGRLPDTPALQLTPASAPPGLSGRVWIDTDAACGASPRTDVDDCLALLLLLLHAPEVQVVGISTVHGNAEHAVVDATVHELLRVLAPERARALPPLVTGAARSLTATTDDPPTPAQQALQAALADGPLTVVALGPLTNLAAALQRRADLQARVERIVAVMGRRRGHLFHPVEGGRAPTWLGHGPVFSDFNVEQDPRAVAAVVALPVPLVLVPYDAARGVVLGPAVIEALRAEGGAARWVAERAGGWLRWWRDAVGIAGFYPFDLMAAAYVVEPALFRCAEVRVGFGADAGLAGWFGARGLFVLAASEPAGALRPLRAASYCAQAVPPALQRIEERIAGGGA